MNTPIKRFEATTTWNFRRAGGLFLGVRYHFPCSIIYATGEVRSTAHLSIGFLFFTVTMEFRGPAVIEEPREFVQAE